MIRFYLRGRIGRHVSWVMPLGGTRSFSRQPRTVLSPAGQVVRIVLVLAIGVTVLAVALR